MTALHSLAPFRTPTINRGWCFFSQSFISTRCYLISGLFFSLMVKIAFTSSFPCPTSCCKIEGDSRLSMFLSLCISVHRWRTLSRTAAVGGVLPFGRCCCLCFWWKYLGTVHDSPVKLVKDEQMALTLSEGIVCRKAQAFEVHIPGFLSQLLHCRGMIYIFANL